MQNFRRQRNIGRIGAERRRAERRRFSRVLAVLVVLALLWVLFAPGAGVVALVRKKMQQHQLEEQIARIKEANVRLSNDIVRLNSDPVFLEQEARKHGMLKKNEISFDFSKSKKK